MKTKGLAKGLGWEGVCFSTSKYLTVQCSPEQGSTSIGEVRSGGTGGLYCMTVAPSLSADGLLSDWGIVTRLWICALS